MGDVSELYGNDCFPDTPCYNAAKKCMSDLVETAQDLRAAITLLQQINSAALPKEFAEKHRELVRKYT